MEITFFKQYLPSSHARQQIALASTGLIDRRHWPKGVDLFFCERGLLVVRKFSAAVGHCGLVDYELVWGFGCVGVGELAF
jgi:hypothetical protein